MSPTALATAAAPAVRDLVVIALPDVPDRDAHGVLAFTYRCKAARSQPRRPGSLEGRAV